MVHWQDADLFKTLLDRKRIGVVSDFDGTLSVLTSDPYKPSITPRNRDLLIALAEKLPLVSVVSGRSAADLRERVGIPGLVYVGGHGLERWMDGAVVPIPEAHHYHEPINQLIQQLDLQPGMSIENKGATMSIHYRNAPDPTAIFQTYDPVMRRLAEQHGLDYFTGKNIFEFRPPLEVNKGTVLRDLVGEYQLDGAIFLGDDVTDADGMKMARQLRQAGTCFAVGLAVESHNMPQVVRESADLLARDIPDVEALLDSLLQAVSEQG
jgi:trehalose 6-phosphate phosphatase